MIRYIKSGGWIVILIVLFIVWLISIPVLGYINHRIDSDVLVKVKKGMTIDEVVELVGNEPVDKHYDGNINNFRIHYYDGPDGVVVFNFRGNKLVSFRSY